MDTSQEYIEMWYKAITMFPELLENWAKSDWDFTWYKTDNPDDPNVLYKYDDFCWIGVQIGGNSICDYPLPRQDQLQDMVELYNYISIGFTCNNGIRGKKAPYKLTIQKFPYWSYPLCFMMESMEQLWLAFVMYEKFNKKWDGAKWQ